jgi:type VI secretion system secreted protein Hcp
MAVDMFLNLDGVKGESKDTIKMQEVLITSVSTGGSGGDDRLTENVSLNFAKVKVEYLPQEAKGGKGNMIPFSWDIAANDDEV